ncbi:gephyrin-like molybdotransferase Glp [Minwuia thermotolerans]|uniref:Molybdopterin molybdenumtransferase n=1 Tax=Minwuia thermotolerans TaxID=2056226 RepID=A0A2M9G1G0_9PROT|nr:gephyrin-like molybdotransferase Glp [Minwuia thermotolerans]PJK29558.1 molybdopterin molybdenumtransferase MoeA [Minwuia thermotolerans]
MIPVAEARGRILAALSPTPLEWVGLERASGRVLAEPVLARRTQPPADMSAMDGYAVRAADTGNGQPLRQIGESAAGHGFDGSIGPGETVRIFTGAPLPEGADAILIQEDAEADGDTIRPKAAVAPGTYVRPAGLDFREGDAGMAAGQEIGPRNIGLLAAMNAPWVPVRRRPRIALLSTGDELVRPGEAPGPDQIISSNALSVGALVAKAGGEPVDIGIAPDRPDALAEAGRRAGGCDMLVTLGGASVGEHDLVQEVLGGKGLDIDFWRIAMRPGKPLMFGRFGDVPLLGLPGNPVSALVCGVIFLRPAIRAMLGAEDTVPPLRRGRLGRDLPANDRREDYLRSIAVSADDGPPMVTPFERQDSSMLSVMSRANALAVRPPHAPAMAAGEPIDYITLDHLA